VGFTRTILSMLLFLLFALVLSTGCENQSTDLPENKNPTPISTNTESQPDPDWGREVSLDEMVAMAKSGQIVEIQWHVMPNVLRAQASDGKIYHLKNENKGVDLRNILIKSGVKIGKGGILFRNVF
jgi:hypothetical protein